MDSEENCVELFTCECGGQYASISAINKHVRKGCRVIQDRLVREGYLNTIRERDSTIERLNAELCSVKQQLAAETARNQAQLGSFVSMAMNHHQQPYYPPPAPVQQPVYAAPLPPPNVVAAAPPPPQIQASEPNITIEVSKPPEPKEKSEPVPKPKDYIDMLNPVDIKEFTELFTRDDYDEETEEGFSYITQDDFKTVLENGSYDIDRHNYWVLDIVERLINRYSTPLSQRPFHSIKDTKTGGFIIGVYQDGDWVFDNDLFEEKFLRCIRSMNGVITHWINYIEAPIIEYRNKENEQWGVRDSEGEIRVEKICECHQTEMLRAISENLRKTVSQPYSLMAEVKKKFILDSDVIIKDMKDPRRKLAVNLEKDKK